MKYSTNNRGRCSAKTPIRRAGAALQMVRSFWINTRIFHLNGYCDSQQISNVRSSPRRSLKGYWPFFCMKGNKRGMAWKSELYTQRNSCFYNIIVKAICQFSDPQWTRWMRTTRDTCVLSIYSSTEGVQAVSLAKMLLLFLLPSLVSGAAYQPGTPGAPWSEQELLTGDFSFKF